MNYNPFTKTYKDPPSEQNYNNPFFIANPPLVEEDSEHE